METPFKLTGNRRPETMRYLKGKKVKKNTKGEKMLGVPKGRKRKPPGFNRTSLGGVSPNYKNKGGGGQRQKKDSCPTDRGDQGGL